jgi:hypothetical protein
MDVLRKLIFFPRFWRDLPPIFVSYDSQISLQVPQVLGLLERPWQNLFAMPCPCQKNTWIRGYYSLHVYIDFIILYMCLCGHWCFTTCKGLNTPCRCPAWINLVIYKTLIHNPWKSKSQLTPKGPEIIFKPFLKFGQAIVKAIFIKNSWIKMWFSTSFKTH